MSADKSTTWDDRDKQHHHSLRLPPSVLEYSDGAPLAGERQHLTRTPGSTTSKPAPGCCSRHSTVVPDHGWECHSSAPSALFDVPDTVQESAACRIIPQGVAACPQMPPPMRTLASMQYSEPMEANSTACCADPSPYRFVSRRQNDLPVSLQACTQAHTGSRLRFRAIQHYGGGGVHLLTIQTSTAYAPRT